MSTVVQLVTNQTSLCHYERGQRLYQRAFIRLHPDYEVVRKWSLSSLSMASKIIYGHQKKHGERNYYIGNVGADDFLTLLAVVRKEIRSIEEKPPKLQSYLIHLNVIKLIAP